MRRFRWTCIDMNGLLPTDWQSDIACAAAHLRKSRDLVPTSVTSREGSGVATIPVMTVGGVTVKENLPWLYDLYHGLFLDFAEETAGETVVTAGDDRYGLVLNVQEGHSMRYECHVDSNPLEGILYCTSHPAGSGGELVVANSTEASDVESVEADASVVYPTAGNLTLFDARHFAHYVRPLRDDHAVRIVAAMNFYTAASPESHRPPDLNRHLFGHD